MSNNIENYQKSINFLESYIKENGTVPTEKVWNKIAFEKEYLTSQSIAYLSGENFPELCKQIYKKVRKSKKIGEN